MTWQGLNQKSRTKQSVQEMKNKQLAKVNISKFSVEIIISTKFQKAGRKLKKKLIKRRNPAILVKKILQER